MGESLDAGESYGDTEDANQGYLPMPQPSGTVRKAVPLFFYGSTWQPPVGSGVLGGAQVQPR